MLTSYKSVSVNDELGANRAITDKTKIKRPIINTFNTLAMPGSPHNKLKLMLGYKLSPLKPIVLINNQLRLLGRYIN